MPEGFDNFFRCDYVHLIGFLRKLGFEYEEARDAAAEAMSCAYENWSSLTSPRGWVRTAAYRIATRDAVRHRRRVSREQELWITVRNNNVDQLQSVEDVFRIASLFEKLPERQRLVMAWHLDGFSTSEIARHMGVQEATVRSTLRHARNRLKQILEPVMQDGASLRIAKEVPGRE